MKKLLILLAFFCAFGHLLQAQDEPLYYTNDVSDPRAEAYFFRNATIQVKPNLRLEKAQMIVRKGTIVQVGTALNRPKDAVEIDLQGMFVYPAFIDLYSDYGLESPKKAAAGNRWQIKEQIGAQTKGAFSHSDAIKAHYNAVDAFSADEKKAKVARALGFGAVLTARRNGLARGTAALVTLSDVPDNELLIKEKAATTYAFDRGNVQQNYPWSKMGYIALLRQTHLNAEWYARRKSKSYVDLSLEAWLAHRKLPQIFDAPGWLQILRADKIGDEFGIQYTIRGNGNEYRRLEALKQTNASLIVPLNFPAPYDVSDPHDTQNITLKDLMHWALAPHNPALLEKNGITFALTAEGAGKDFLKNLRKATAHGLSTQKALAALTQTPAKILQVEQQIGSLEAGKIANFLVCSGDIFTDNEAIIYENWIRGKPFVLADRQAAKLKGEYETSVNNKNYRLKIDGAPGKYTFSLIENDSTTVTLKGKAQKNLLTLVYEDSKNPDKNLRISAWQEGKNLKGQGQKADGSWFDWQATFKSEHKKADQKTAEAVELPEIPYPFLPFGNVTPPKQKTLLFKNATVWTNEAEGIRQESDVLVENGKISRVGKNLSAPNAEVIDATGKHLTSGIIDEHSHIALSAVNDLNVVSAMVRMEDVVNSEDIDIYRQLAGGVTASQLLHGSANPVGGQSALIKMRWGATPQEMLIKNADGFIKFALGENVKRSFNPNSIRYPQTRMGVEQVYMDVFSRAKAYDEKWKNYNKSPKSKQKNPPRRDLMLETMAEILNKKRFISCHSYVQSEINMLMKVAEKFGFKIDIFTHILEGYKIADKMAAHGAAGSSFADWWAYKFEVRYAIPYNPALMAEAGVTTAINSDDAEMGRRLNQEAAKSVKYGGMSQEDAWKMVTLNPAKMLHLDERMGSIKAGKDADLVLWTNNPLSIYAKVEKTVVDGKVLFDRAEDLKKRQKNDELRRHLLAKMANSSKKSGEKTRQPSGEVEHNFHCDDWGISEDTF